MLLSNTGGNAPIYLRKEVSRKGNFARFISVSLPSIYPASGFYVSGPSLVVPEGDKQSLGTNPAQDEA